MPFTPFHLGPALLFATTLDFPTFLIANVIVDFEPFLVMTYDLDLRYGYPLHGFFHTFLGGALVALILAEGMVVLYSQFGKEVNIKKLRITALSGIWLHIVLDSFLYMDIKPFFPLSWNPFYGLFSGIEVYGFCVVAFVIGALLHIVTKRKWES
ncbi:metal-dependent hydrolase [Pyrococcus yayanosii]|uniref:Membrane-bound metal-dependent hydrolase n=1 Tax=Pyrococcus yayanosii (strain CH1 / JCM 16557) TaxID=529709 RepID=F8AG63_PYRYC|nr:hypothetical protein [Pyrococcus yayanosii]AEH23899.1 hypothetical protein PYCH_01970 [Pyrococcus yayanosii CH1]